MALPRDLNTVTEAHLLALIDSQAPEGPHLEFKRDLPGADRAAKEEFLADVSAFANSGGGDLVYGVEENAEGAAARIAPLLCNPDNERLRLLNILGDSLEPRIPGLQVQPVPVQGGCVVCIRVPQSWAGPHRVRPTAHFYVRESARKRQLDVPELRSMFLRSEQQAEKVRNFRADRLGKILTGEGVPRLVDGALLVVHLVPTQAALGLVQVDPVPYSEHAHLPLLGSASQNSCRINIDGALALRNLGQEGTHGYSLFFRNGFFESVKVLRHGSQGRASLGKGQFEQVLANLFDTIRGEYVRLGVTPELCFMVSILHADQVELGLIRFNYDDHQGFFDRQTLVLPDVLISAESSGGTALREVFDLVWQAAGLQGSPSFNDAGEWVPRGR